MLFDIKWKLSTINKQKIMSWDKFICLLFWGIICYVNGVVEKRDKFPKILDPFISNLKY